MPPSLVLEDASRLNLYHLEISGLPWSCFVARTLACSRCRLILATVPRMSLLAVSSIGREACLAAKEQLSRRRAGHIFAPRHDLWSSKTRLASSISRIFRPTLVLLCNTAKVLCATRFMNRLAAGSSHADENVVTLGRVWGQSTNGAIHGRGGRNVARMCGFQPLWSLKKTENTPLFSSTRAALAPSFSCSTVGRCTHHDQIPARRRGQQCLLAEYKKVRDDSPDVDASADFAALSNPPSNCDLHRIGRR
ncbi:hypothetical protein C8R46DRAFT_1235753 [Mycena filopes]|nr:hypothetical protein C8R46DRAFT_1235753 [Mycena filopes]